MELLGGRGSNYTLLRQIPDDRHQPPPPKLSAPRRIYYEFNSGEKNDGVFDWDSTDYRMTQQQLNQMGAAPFSTSIGLQRQSSGSNFGESELSGDGFKNLTYGYGNSIYVVG